MNDLRNQYTEDIADEYFKRSETYHSAKQAHYEHGYLEVEDVTREERSYNINIIKIQKGGKNEKNEIK